MINLFGPGIDAAGQVVNMLEACIRQKADAARGTNTGAAEYNIALIAVELVKAVTKPLQGDVDLAREDGHLLFDRIADIQKPEGLALFQPGGHFGRFNIETRADQTEILILSGDAAKLLIIDEMGNGRMLAADDAVRVLAQIDRLRDRK